MITSPTTFTKTRKYWRDIFLHISSTLERIFQWVFPRLGERFLRGKGNISFPGSNKVKRKNVSDTFYDKVMVYIKTRRQDYTLLHDCRLLTIPRKGFSKKMRDLFGALDATEN